MHVNLTIYTRRAEKREDGGKKKERMKKKRAKPQRRATGGSALYAGRNAFIGADNVGSLLSRAHKRACERLSFLVVFDARVKRD